MGKGKHVLYEQFLPFPQSLQKRCTVDKGLFGKGLNYKLCYFYRELSLKASLFDWLVPGTNLLLFV